MRITRYDSGLLCSSTYVVQEGEHALVIDPGRPVPLPEGLQVDKLLITHEHYDHIFGVNRWKEETGAPLLCSEAAARRITSSTINQARYFPAFCQMQSYSAQWDEDLIDAAYTTCAEESFSDSLDMEWQGHRLRLVELPGHSPGSIGIYIDDTDFFSGDSILEHHEVELRFPGGSRQAWEARSEKIIRDLPEGIRIWPGHYDGFVWHRREAQTNSEK